ncbi:MAG TPA: glycosyltransferase family 2 protein [Terriglobia bacterium]|nr:glycosyltransferase family 2 protein [Terriglobia bacterium]
MADLPAYVVITPARNEAQFIELTLNSMVAQTVKPLKWVIVSDGSTDGTDEIVSRYATEYPWIELVRMPERTERHFAGKVYAFNAGYSRVKDLDYAVVVSMDADISFEEDYFAFLLEKLTGDSRLGLVGTPFRDSSNGMYDYRFVSIEHVSGACQVFRRECFEAIGGYRPVKSGGIDLIAVLSARAAGWRTRTFAEKSCLHHRSMGTLRQRSLSNSFRRGRMDYLLGSHPVWEIFRSIYQVKRKSHFIGGILMLAGYFWTMLNRVERTMPQDLVSLRRDEQLRRLKRTFRRAFGRLTAIY